jgi:hypothetical protein
MKSTSYLTLAALALAGCASTGPVAPPKITTSAPAPVEPRADVVNASVVATSRTAIIVSVLIDDRTITLEQATLARVPDRKRTELRKEGETVTFEGLRGADVVSTITVPDQAINVEEQKGLVRLVRRSLQVPVPAPRAIDAVRVTVHSNGATATLRIDPSVYKLCEYAREEPVCRDLPRPAQR